MLFRSNIITVRFIDNNTDYTLRLTDLSGREVGKYKSLNGTVIINKGELAAGVYNLITSTDGNQISMSKIIFY